MFVVERALHPVSQLPGPHRFAAVLLALITALTGSTICAQAHQPQSNEADDGNAVAIHHGWQLYQTRCALCHGPDATGSLNAPNLLQVVPRLDAVTFLSTVLARHPYGIRSDAGASESDAERKVRLDEIQQRAEGKRLMPDWSSDQDVRHGIGDLYRFIQARADGSLGVAPPANPRDH